MMLMEMMVAMGAAATANPAKSTTMSIDGDRVTFSETIDDRGVRRISGRRLSDGQRFAFRVTPDGQVRGSVGIQNVNFDVGSPR
jgi:hypothetical protein